MQQNIVEANRNRDLYLYDGINIYFIPQAWCDEWSVAKGFTGGLDYIENGIESPEVYCYAPTHVFPNSPVETLFVKVKDLQVMTEISEGLAKTLHPTLFSYLDSLNQGLKA